MFACRLLGITLAVEMFGMTYNSYVVKWPRETPMIIPGPKFYLKLDINHGTLFLYQLNTVISFLGVNMAKI